MIITGADIGKKVWIVSKAWEVDYSSGRSESKTYIGTVKEVNGEIVTLWNDATEQTIGYEEKIRQSAIISFRLWDTNKTEEQKKQESKKITPVNCNGFY